MLYMRRFLVRSPQGWSRLGLGGREGVEGGGLETEGHSRKSHQQPHPLALATPSAMTRTPYRIPRPLHHTQRTALRTTARTFAVGALARERVAVRAWTSAGPHKSHANCLTKGGGTPASKASLQTPSFLSQAQEGSRRRYPFCCVPFFFLPLTRTLPLCVGVDPPPQLYCSVCARPPWPPLHHCPPAQVYRCTAALLHRCTAAPSHPF